MEQTTINKLCEQNGDFAKFVEDVKIDFESKRIHKAEYDEIPKDPGKYIGESWESNNQADQVLICWQ